MPISEKILLAMIIWVLLSLVIMLGSGLEVLLTLILIGILMIRELTESFASARSKNRMDSFICAFLLVFSLLVARRIWGIL